MSTTFLNPEKLTASKTVFIGKRGLRELFSQKFTNHHNFSSDLDPDKTNLCMYLEHSTTNADGTGDPCLGIGLHNSSRRKIYIEHCSIALFKSEGPRKPPIELKECSEKNFFLKSGRAHGWRNVYTLSELDAIMDAATAFQEFRIVMTVVYGGANLQTEVPSQVSATRPLGSLAGDIARLWADEDTDVTLEVGDKLIPAHKLILKARSSYFKTMFTVEMKERESKIVKIEECDGVLFQAMLKYLYTDEPPTDLDEIAGSLLVVADRFLVEPLKQICAQSLLKNLNRDNLRESMLLAHKFSCLDLKRECFGFMVDKLKESERVLLYKDGFDTAFFEDLSNFLSARNN